MNKKLVRRLERIEDEYRRKLIEDMLRDQRRFWKRVAELLARPRRKRIEVNVEKLDKLCNEGETVVVPGVVLGKGELSKPLTVVAYKFSSSAKQRIEKAGGKAVELLDFYPAKEVRGLRIVI